MYNIDERDRRLIKLLEQDAWQTSDTLAKSLGVSPATVRRRRQLLLRNGVLRATAVHLDQSDRQIKAIIALNISYENIDNVMQTLAVQPEIMWIASTTGRFDVFVLVQFNSTEELSQYLRGRLTRIEGIKNSETFVCLYVEKGKQLVSVF
ncbi:MAG: Lrp/AsnC family transcriptional regulator [Chloroflexi bacterium]|nr:Lrp/AsnC family transcriptional regulator [Chloroflexota bacterium]